VASRTPGRLPRPEKTSHSVRLIDESIGDNPHAAEGLRRKKRLRADGGERSDAPPSAALPRRMWCFRRPRRRRAYRSGERMQKADGHAALDAGRG